MLANCDTWQASKNILRRLLTKTIFSFMCFRSTIAFCQNKPNIVWTISVKFLVEKGVLFLVVLILVEFLAGHKIFAWAVPC